MVHPGISSKGKKSLELQLTSLTAFDIMVKESTSDPCRKVIESKNNKIGSVHVGLYSSVSVGVCGNIFIKDVYDKKGNPLRSYISYEESFGEKESLNIKMLFEVLDGEHITFVKRG